MVNTTNVENENLEYPKVIIFHAIDAERDKIITPVLENLEYGRKDVWVLKTGVGKVNAAMSASVLLGRFKKKDTLCINVGVCGGNEKALKESPCAVIDRVVEGDFDTSFVDGVPFDRPKLSLTKSDKDLATCFTQDHITSKLSDISEVAGIPFNSSDELVYADMELYAIAKVCSTLGFRLTAIKSVSDVIGEDGQADQYLGDGFAVACERAADELDRVLVKVLG